VLRFLAQFPTGPLAAFLFISFFCYPLRDPSGDAFYLPFFCVPDPRPAILSVTERRLLSPLAPKYLDVSCVLGKCTDPTAPNSTGFSLFDGCFFSFFSLHPTTWRVPPAEPSLPLRLISPAGCNDRPHWMSQRSACTDRPVLLWT